MLEDIRTYARLQLGITHMTREQYLVSVIAYATERHGDGHETKLIAERTARYFWDQRA